MAVKTEEEIESDFYLFITNSVIAKTIKGKVYRDDMRPANSTAEDLVLKFLAGLDEQVQTGVVIVNLYVPDITKKDGRKVIDHARVKVLQKVINQFVEDNSDTEYYITKDGTPTTPRNEEIGQHFIYVRLKFQRITV